MMRITDLITDKFGFLRSKFNCEVLSKDETNRFASVLYQNINFALSVVVDMEFRDVFVTFYKVDKKDSILKVPLKNGFSLDDHIYVKTGSYPRKKGVLKIFTTTEVGPVLDLEVKYLKKYGIDLLEGDFSTYPRILKVMNNRVKQLEEPLKKKYPDFFKKTIR